MKRVLVVEDEASIREMVALNLKMAGWDVLEAESAEAALELLSKNPGCDAALLDVMLPGMNGFSLCETIRRDDSEIGIIILSAKGQEEDKVRGLSIGADDYITKPFSVRELIARVRALLRRSSGQMQPQGNTITASGITLNEDAHTATGEKGQIDLTPREFELLAALMKQAGNVVSREDLLHEAWGWEYLTETKTVDTHIKRLRDKINAAGYDSGIVETVRGYGYRFRK